MMVAEELNIDWKNVVVDMAPHDNLKFGSQFTGGSQSVWSYWKPLRTAGASVRNMLHQAAAQNWNVPLDEVTTKVGVVHHEKTDQSATYGQVASKAADMSVPKDVRLKTPNEFTIVRNGKRMSKD